VYVGTQSIHHSRYDQAGRLIKTEAEAIRTIEQITGKQVVVLDGPDDIHNDRYHVPLGATQYGKHTSLVADPVWALKIIASMSADAREEAIKNILRFVRGTALEKNEAFTRDRLRDFFNVTPEKIKRAKKSDFVRGLAKVIQILESKGIKVMRVPGLPKEFAGNPFGIFPTNVIMDNISTESGGRAHRTAIVPHYGIPSLDTAVNTTYEGLSFEVLPVMGVVSGSADGGPRCHVQAVAIERGDARKRSPEEILREQIKKWQMLWPPSVITSAARMAESANIFSENRVKSGFPLRVAANLAKLGWIASADTLPLIAGGRLGTIPVAISPARMAVLSVSAQADGVRVIRQVDSSGNSMHVRRFNRSAIREAAARRTAARSASPVRPDLLPENDAVGEAVRVYREKDQITRQHLDAIVRRWAGAKAAEKKSVVIAVGIQGQDLSAAAKEMDEFRSSNEKNLTVLIEWVDEDGNRMEEVHGGYRSDSLPKEGTVHRIYAGVLNVKILKKAVAEGAGYLPMEEAVHPDGGRSVTYYKPTFQAAAATVLAESVEDYAHAAQALNALMGRADLHRPQVRLIQAPDATTKLDDYTAKGLIVKAGARLSQGLYGAYLSEREAGSSA
jgi:hypothetical protein